MDRTKDKVIELQGACYAYDGEIALRYIDLDVYRHEAVSLMGGNGCGKSTLIRMLNGLIFPEEGKYIYEGREITAKKMQDNKFSKWFHQQVGYVFQNSDAQLFCATVEDEIQFGPLQMGLSEEEAAERTEDVIRLLELSKLRNRAPYHLSGGEKRKTALACVLSMNPKVLILDEPLAGLDQKTQEWLVDFLVRLRDSGKTIITATHNERFAERLSDRIVEMNEDHRIERIRSVRQDLG